jgi:hypothetical protein
MKAVFVQNNFIERISGPLAVVARESGYELHDISILPDEPFDADALGIDWEIYDRVFVYGSVGFVRRCLHSSLRKYVVFDQDRLAASRWVDEFGLLALNHGGRIVEFSDVRKLLETGPMHLRPDNHEKAFTGAVFTPDTWDEIIETRSLGDISGLQCWASPVQEIAAEYRCFIVDGRPVEISLYRKDGRADRARVEDVAVFQAVQRLCDVHLPMPTVVMDVAMTADGYKVIEFNPVHGSGWYAVDIAHVLEAVMHASKLGLTLEADDLVADNGPLSDRSMKL